MANKMTTVSGTAFNAGNGAAEQESAAPAFYLNLTLKGSRDERSFKLFAENPRHAAAIKHIENRGAASPKGQPDNAQRAAILALLMTYFDVNVRPGARAEPDVDAAAEQALTADVLADQLLAAMGG